MTSRDVQRRLKELAAALKAEPGSIPKRLELAAALRDAKRPADAIELYRGVAEVYAEEGRLVQAMAVCKGILEIDPGHRDTLEMLATLAQRRTVRKPHPAEVRQEGGRWIAEPAAPSETTLSEGAMTPPSLTIGPGPAAPQYASEATRAGADPDATRAGAEEVSAVRLDLSAGVRNLPSVELEIIVGDGIEPGGRRLDTARDLATVEPGADGAEPVQRDTVRMATLTEEELAGETLRDLPRPVVPSGADETRAAVRSALEAGRAPSEAPQHGGAREDDPDATLLDDALKVPFERPPLLVEPPPFPLLSDLPRGAFMELLTRLTLLRLEPGALVVREGEPGDACYLIAAGSVRVTKAGIELAVLGPGAFFGEFAVLADQTRHASVEASEPVELLEIKRALIDELVAAHPGVARTLRKFYQERLISTLMATAPFFQELQPEERVALAERFRPRRFGRGARVIEEGAPGGGLYLILVGEVQVVRAAGEGDDEIVLGSLGEGSYFGEMSLLKGGVASATVRATRMTEVVQLPPRDFYEVVSQHPVLWEQLRSEAERRELANHAIVAGEARKTDDGTVYLV